MKNIYFILVFLLLLGITPIFGQVGGCNFLSSIPEDESCPAPWLRVTFDIPVVCGNNTFQVRVSVCYYCFITGNEVCYIIKKIEVPEGAASCVQTSSLKSQAEQWLIHHTTKYCGLEVCGTFTPPTIRIAFPMCATISFTPSNPPGGYGSYTIKYSEGECQRFCIKSFNWCWCNCVPGECWDERCPNPHVVISNETYVPSYPFSCSASSYEIYSCDPTGEDMYRYNMRASYPWSDCFIIKTGCNNYGFDGPIPNCP